jgi:hypothetical protein
MDNEFRVLDSGTVYIEKGSIVEVLPEDAPVPAGFESTSKVKTGGTIYPGLIELHNHLAYNILQLWDVPKQYGDRGEWQGSTPYRQLVSGPMGVIGRTPGLMPAVVRYVECKCLFGGTTTSQGIRLYSSQGSQVYYRGLIRNVEAAGDPDLPNANALIPDPDAQDHDKFLARLKRATCYLVHLSEGADDDARKHFLGLNEDGEWAIAQSMAGIHCAGLHPEDFEVLASFQASMVWSPLSNLLLYGATADVKAAKAAGVRVGLGADWSPSGSKNLLGELKVARVVSQENGGVFSDRELVAMATCEAARILRWDKFLGSIEAGKRADVIVISDTAADPYAGLIAAPETDIGLVMINGVARFGLPGLMKDLGASGAESVEIGGRKRTLYLAQQSADINVATIKFSQARKMLAKALQELPNHNKSAVFRKGMPKVEAFRPGAPPVWFLALDEIADTGLDLRPHLPYRGETTGAPEVGKKAAVPPALVPLELDKPTAADDETFLERLQAERNLPQYLKDGLRF